LRKRWSWWWYILGCVSFSFVSGTAFAWPPIFGPEWEFTNHEIYSKSPGAVVDAPMVVRAQLRMVNRIVASCPGCNVKREKNRYGSERFRITFPELDGWWILVDTDPGVVEVQAQPLTLAQFTRYAPEIQSLIFDSARYVGLDAGYRKNAQHFHMGLEETFGDDGLFFRNFIVDFANHAELASGVLERDFENAPPIAALPVQKQEEFGRVIDEFDASGAEGPRKLAAAIYRRVYNVTVDPTSVPAEKYHDVGLARMVETGIAAAERTVEIRANHTMPTVQGFNLVLELMSLRLEYLKKLSARGKRISFIGARSRAPVADELEGAFQQYVVECGGSWERFKVLLKEYRGGLRQVTEDSALPEKGRAWVRAVKTAGDSSPPIFSTREEMDRYYGGKIHPLTGDGRRRLCRQAVAAKTLD
jgi:hypothetical protein